jgi:cyclopropane fatty-acyl-phospholipid synthase-like methyltransferase
VAGFQECQCFERFSERYRVASNEVTRQIERAVIGADWGANGYTTVEQADRLASEVGLGPSSLVLDLGSGRGWPGLYLAATTGCRVVMSDVPQEALRFAVTRAGAEKLDRRAPAVRCSARRLPFAPSTFDAIVHTDVLCCLRPKLTVLRECARLLIPGGRMAFFTIHPADGLGPADRRRAARHGPIAVSVSRPHRELLKAAGFVQATETDYSDEFMTTTQAWTEQWDLHRDEMDALWGCDAVRQRQRERKSSVRTTRAGILRRTLFTARLP